MEKVERAPGDFTLVLSIILLLGVGLSVLFSASYYHAETTFGSPYFFLRRQVLRVIIGGVLAYLASRLPTESLRRYTPLLLFGSLVLMVLTFVPGIGTQVQGSRRWLFAFGLSFEPSEAVKFAVVLYLANLFSKKKDKLNDPLNTLLPPLIVVVVFVSLIYLQNDFSTSFFLLFVSFLMFYIAGIRLIYFLLLAGLAVPLGFLLLFTKEHRVRRLIAFIDPAIDPSGSGYQIITARSALVDGGFLGKGLGKSVAKLGRLPEAHSDFIFAVVGEEIGLVGVVFVIVVFAVFAWRGYLISHRCEDSYRYYLAFGITTLVFFQSVLNMAVVAGIVPATGLPLPFFSSGGSSIVMTLFMCGILVRLSTEASGLRRPPHV